MWLDSTFNVKSLMSAFVLPHKSSFDIDMRDRR